MTENSGERRHLDVVVDGSTPPAVAVVNALSKATGDSAADLDLELNEHVDPDALNQLFAPRFGGEPRPGGTVVFEMLDYVVKVSTGEGDPTSPTQ